MRPDDTTAAEHRWPDVAGARHDLELLRERSAQACQATHALRQRALASCELSRVTREAVVLARIQWHVWRETRRAARLLAGTTEPAVLVVCEQCEAVCFMSRAQLAARAELAEPGGPDSSPLFWCVPPLPIRQSLRSLRGAPSVEHVRCPSCATAPRGESLVRPSAPARQRDLATNLLAVLAELSAPAEALGSDAPRLGEQEALAPACDAAIERLEDSVSPDEMAEFADALSALLRALHGVTPVESAREARTRPASRSARFRPRLRGR